VSLAWFRGSVFFFAILLFDRHHPSVPTCTRDLLARAAAVWIIASLVPATFLARLFALTLYAIPETDDFCFSYMNAANGFVETVSIWYKNAVGLIVPLFLIQVPAAISGATGIDYFVSYAATLAALEISFAAAIVLAAFWLWPQASFPQNVFVGAALAATMLSDVPSLREMLYWLPGVACYTLPGVIVVLVLTDFVRADETGARFRLVATCMLAIGCFLASLCNEFTPAWLIGIVLCSLTVRAIFRDELQLGEHAIIVAATLGGFSILLLAPGNAVRIGMFPLAGQFSRSAIDAYLIFAANLKHLILQPQTLAWLVVATIFTLRLPQAARD
jgi:Family of unknown function (DUF6056)